MNAITISSAGPGEMEIVRSLFRAYQQSIGVDLCFQNFEKELRELPGEYSPPGGTILLARRSSLAGGCAALRRIDDATCEMKRLYVPPEFRGEGIGRMLAVSIIGVAREKGYSVMKLDTLPSMREAIAMYESLGFRRSLPYRYNPLEGAIYMQLDL